MSSHRKMVIFFLISVVLSFFFVMNSLAVAVGENIKIGAVLPRTGPGATLGVQAIHGVQLAAEMLNKTGGIAGRPVELLVRDDETNPEKSVGHVKNLSQREKVILILGSSLSACCFAMEPITRELGVPMYCMSPVTIPNLTSGLAFNGPWEPLRWLGRLPLAYFKSEGITKVGVLATTETSGKLNVGWINESAKDLGIEIVATEYFNINDIDVVPQMARIRKANPQGIYFSAGGSTGLTVLKTVRQLDIKIPVYTGSSNATYTFASQVGDVPNAFTGGAKIHIWQELPDSDPQKTVIKTFVQAYEREYPEKADLYAAIGYDAVNIFAKAIATVGTDSKRIVGYLETELNTYTGVSSTFKSMRDHRGTADAPGIILRYYKGGFKLVKVLEKY